MSKEDEKLVGKIVRISFSDDTYVDVFINTFLDASKDEMERQAIIVLKGKLEERSRQLWR